MENLPLAGLHIVVTRPREQADYLASEIEKLGGRCIRFPLLEISGTRDPQILQNLISRLHDFHLAIFISPNAVRYGIQAITATRELPPDLQFAAIGQGSAKYLHEHGVHSVLTPQTGADSEALLSLPEMQQIRGKHIVIFRGDGGRELLGDTLRQRGATVEYATCYLRSQPQLDIATLLAAQPDVISVSSSEALRNLHDMLDTASRRIILPLPLFVTHERIASAAHKLGWRNIISSNGGDHGLLSALITWTSQRKGKQS